MSATTAPAPGPSGRVWPDQVGSVGQFKDAVLGLLTTHSNVEHGVRDVLAKRWLRYENEHGRYPDTLPSRYGGRSIKTWRPYRTVDAVLRAAKGLLGTCSERDLKLAIYRAAIDFAEPTRLGIPIPTQALLYGDVGRWVPMAANGLPVTAATAQALGGYLVVFRQHYPGEGEQQIVDYVARVINVPTDPDGVYTVEQGEGSLAQCRYLRADTLEGVCVVVNSKRALQQADFDRLYASWEPVELGTNATQLALDLPSITGLVAVYFQDPFGRPDAQVGRLTHPEGREGCYTLTCDQAVLTIPAKQLQAVRLAPWYEAHVADLEKRWKGICEEAARAHVAHAFATHASKHLELDSQAARRGARAYALAATQGVDESPMPPLDVLHDKLLPAVSKRTRGNSQAFVYQAQLLLGAIGRLVEAAPHSSDVSDPVVELIDLYSDGLHQWPSLLSATGAAVGAAGSVEGFPNLSAIYTHLNGRSVPGTSDVRQNFLETAAALGTSGEVASFLAQACATYDHFLTLGELDSLLTCLEVVRGLGTTWAGSLSLLSKGRVTHFRYLSSPLNMVSAYVETIRQGKCFPSMRDLRDLSSKIVDYFTIEKRSRAQAAIDQAVQLAPLGVDLHALISEMANHRGVAVNMSHLAMLANDLARTCKVTARVLAEEGTGLWRVADLGMQRVFEVTLRQLVTFSPAAAQTYARRALEWSEVSSVGFERVSRSVCQELMALTDRERSSDVLLTAFSPTVLQAQSERRY